MSSPKLHWIDEMDGLIIEGDIIAALAQLEDESVEAIVTDPPYELNFMGRSWDNAGVSFRAATWGACLRVLKPGGHLVVFGSTRTHHRMWCAIEDAGFEVRDMLTWNYGQGFPKSMNIGKAIDKSGATTEAAQKFNGWGTALKPACEPILLARKPLSEKTVADNVLKHGTGALNIDATRISTEGEVISTPHSDPAKREGVVGSDLGFSKGDKEKMAAAQKASVGRTNKLGRWPANFMLQCTCDDPQPVPEEGGFFHQPDCPAGMLDSESRGASRFFTTMRFSDQELLLGRAKAMMEAWNNDLANTVDENSNLPGEAVASALNDAVILASQGEILLNDCQVLSMNATPNELKRLCENAIALTLSIDPKSLPASFHIDTGPLSANHAKNVVQKKQIGTTTTTPNHTSSDGYAVVVTLTTTKSNTEAGAAAFATRFRYCPKATKKERGEDNTHPTVKPLALMRYLVRLVTPLDGVVLDPFCGSGSTLIAATEEGFGFIGSDINDEYVGIALRRLQGRNA